MYNFFIEWENSTTSCIAAKRYDIKDNALFLYAAIEEKCYEPQDETQTISAMVVPFSSMRYFTYE